jgi:hypothetical protein
LSSIPAKFHRRGADAGHRTPSPSCTTKIKSTLPRSLVMCLTLASVIAVKALPYAARYNEALVEISHRQVSLNRLVKSSVEAVKVRFPGAILAACAPTGSMKPTLDENYIVLLQDCTFGRLRRGDIILTRLGSGAECAAVMHRIEDSEGLGNLQTRGDALKKPDPIHTTTANYLGKRAVAAIHLETGAISWLLTEQASRQRCPTRRN